MQLKLIYAIIVETPCNVNHYNPGKIIYKDPFDISINTFPKIEELLPEYKCTGQTLTKVDQN